jgi:hypothetical protein
MCKSIGMHRVTGRDVSASKYLEAEASKGCRVFSRRSRPAG